MIECHFLSDENFLKLYCSFLKKMVLLKSKANQNILKPFSKTFFIKHFEVFEFSDKMFWQIENATSFVFVLAFFQNSLFILDEKLFSFLWTYVFFSLRNFGEAQFGPCVATDLTLTPRQTSCQHNCMWINVPLRRYTSRISQVSIWRVFVSNQPKGNQVIFLQQTSFEKWSPNGCNNY